MWFVVTSTTRGVTRPGYSWAASSPFEEMQKQRSAGRHITDVAYGNGYWVISAHEVAAFGDQVFATGGSFPQSFISDNWGRGYDITELSYGGGRWVVVMTKLASGPSQRWWWYNSSRWSEERRTGRQILDMVSADGGHLMVTTHQLGEVMGFPPPSGGVLASPVQSYSSTTARFTVDLFVVGSDSELLELRPRDFSISGGDLGSTGTRVSYRRRAGVRTFRQRSRGSYSAMFLLDQSGSILSTDPTDARIDAAKAFMRGLGGRDEAGLAAFASGGRLQYQPLTFWRHRGRVFARDEDAWDGELNWLADREGGSTPLYDATRSAVDLTAKHGRNNNRAVLLFTDGEDTASRYSLQDAVAEARRRRVALHTIALSDSVNFFVLARMARETGGAMAFARDARRLISYYGALGKYLSGAGRFYRTTWQANLRGGSFRFRRGAAMSSYMRINIPGSSISLPFVVAFQ